MKVRLLNGGVHGGWRIVFHGLPGKLDSRHPSQKLPCCYPDYLLCGDGGRTIEIERDDIIVYALGETAETGEVLCTTRRPLPGGTTIVAIFFAETGELFDLALSLDYSGPLIHQRLKLRDRIYMALGSRGVVIPPHITEVGYS